MPVSLMSLVHQLSVSPVTLAGYMWTSLSQAFMGDEAIDTDPSESTALAVDKECHLSVVSAIGTNPVAH